MKKTYLPRTRFFQNKEEKEDFFESAEWQMLLIGYGAKLISEEEKTVTFYASNSCD